MQPVGMFLSPALPLESVIPFGADSYRILSQALASMTEGVETASGDLAVSGEYATNLREMLPALVVRRCLYGRHGGESKALARLSALRPSKHFGHGRL